MRKNRLGLGLMKNEKVHGCYGSGNGKWEQPEVLGQTPKFSCDLVTKVYTEVKQLNLVVCAISKDTKNIEERQGTNCSNAGLTTTELTC